MLLYANLCLCNINHAFSTNARDSRLLSLLVCGKIKTSYLYAVSVLYWFKPVHRPKRVPRPQTAPHLADASLPSYSDHCRYWTANVMTPSSAVTSLRAQGTDAIWSCIVL